MKVTVQKKDDQRNIFKGGNLVIANSGTIVLITENADEQGEYFTGVSVANAQHTVINPIYSNIWSKVNYTQFHGTITIDL